MTNTSIDITEKIVNNIKRCRGIALLSDEDKIAILDAYKVIAEVEAGIQSDSVISNNIMCYSKLLNKTMYYATMADSSTKYFKDYVRENNIVLNLLNGGSNKISKLASKYSVDYNTAVTADSLKEAISSFGKYTLSSEDTEGNIEDDDIIDDYDFDSILSSDLGIDDSDFEDVLGTDNEDDEEVEEVDNIEDTDSIEEEITDEYRNEFREKAIRTATGICSTLKQLYETGYSGVIPQGILTDKGLLSYGKFTDKKNGNWFGQAINGGNTQLGGNHSENPSIKNKFIEIHKSILYAFGVIGLNATISKNSEIEVSKADKYIDAGRGFFGQYIDGRKDNIPKIADIGSGAKLIYPRMHEKFMYGYFDLCSGLEEFAKKRKFNMNSKKVTNYNQFNDYIVQEIADMFIRAYKDSGITDATSTEVLRINALMSNTIKNIIICAEDTVDNLSKARTNISTNIRICCANAETMATRLPSVMETYLNLGLDGSATTSVKVKEVCADVIDLDIIYNSKKYDNNGIMSADVIDDIIMSGEIPSWGNVILGRSDTNKLIRKNLKTDKARCLYIYGSSGSGKGIMTSALLTSAVVDNCIVFYVDGKPDNGAAIAKVAWDMGCEAPVFNGPTPFSDTFHDYIENYSHGIRTLAERYSCINIIPDEIVANLNDRDKEMFKKSLIDVSITLNAFKLLSEIVSLRSDPNNFDGRWLVYVIDEIQNAAKEESKIRNKLTSYLEKFNKKYETHQEEKRDRQGNVSYRTVRDGKMTDDENISKHPDLKFCFDWLDWADSVSDKWTTAVTIGLRNAKITLITIFQDNDWLKGNSEQSKTTIWKMMIAAKSITTRIVGKGGFKSAGETVWGDGDTNKLKCISELNKGKWVFGKPECKIDDKDMVFKPFRVFTTNLGPNTFVPTDDRFAGSQNCRKSLNEDGEPPLGLDAYLRYLFNGLSDVLKERAENSNERFKYETTPEGVLQSSYDYVNNLLINSGVDSSGVKHFMYTLPLGENTSDSNIESSEKLPSDGIDLSDYNNVEEEINIDDLNRGKEIDFGDDSEDVPAVSNSTYSNRSIDDDILNTVNDIMGVNSSNINTDSFNEESDNEYFFDEDNNDERYDSDSENGKEDSEKVIHAEDRFNTNSFNDTGNIIKNSFGCSADIEASDGRQTLSRKGREIIVEPRSTDRLTKLTNENSMRIGSYASDKMHGVIAKLYQSRTGVSYDYRKRLEWILNSIIKEFNNDESLITRVILVGNQFVVNNRTVDISNMIGGDYDVRFSDILDIKYIMSRLSYVQSLSLDSTSFSELQREYGYNDEDLANVFRSNRNLRQITLHEKGEKPFVILREDFDNRSNKVEKLSEKAKERHVKDQIDAMASAYNPNIKNNTPVEKYRMYRQAQSISEAMNKKAYDRIMNGDNKYFRAAGQHVVAQTLYAGATVMHGILSAPVTIFRMFRR